MANPDMDQPRRRRDPEMNDITEERTPGSSENIRGVGDEDDDEFEDAEEIDDEDMEEDIER
jgi:hypothetical protein